MCEMESDLSQTRISVVSSTVQVCIICLDMDRKLFSMTKCNLEKAYENLTGHSLCNVRDFKQTLCFECAQRLINFKKFRDKSLRAHSLLMDLFNKHQSVTKGHIKSIDRVANQLQSDITMITLEPDCYNDYGLEHTDEYKDTEIDTLVEEDTENIIVKKELNDESISLNDEDHADIKLEVEYNETDNNVDFLLPYDDDVSDASNIRDTKPTNNDQCRVVLRKISNFEVSEIQKTLKHPKFVYTCETCFKKFSTEAELDVHKTISTCYTLTMELACTDERVRATAADCEPALAAALTARLATNDEIETHPTDRFEAGTLGNNIKVFEIDSDVTDSKPYENNKRTHDISNKIKDRAENHVSENSEHLGKPTDIKRFICDVCRNVFDQNYLLVKHIKTHSKVKVFVCKFCEYKCFRKYDLVSHMRTHTGEKPFACKLCKYKCSHKSGLVSHMRTHTGEKPFACKLCKYKSVHKSGLVCHMRTHTGEKPFACKLCHYKCSREDYLVSHMRTHTGEKPFTCKLCKHKCSHKSGLVSHMRTHTSEKPFACKLCKHKYSYKSSLVRHMKTHTGEKPFATNMDNILMQ